MSVNSEWFRLKVIYFALVSVAAVGMKVCCPKTGGGGDPLTSNNTNFYEYECDDLSSVKNNEQNFNYSNSTRTRVIPKYGKCHSKSQIVLLVGNNTEIIDGNRTCLGVNKTDYHAIECSMRFVVSDSNLELFNSTNTKRINRIKKCCHFDSIYDKMEKICRHLTSDDSPASAAMDTRYKNLFDEPVILETENSQFMCNSDEVLIMFNLKKKLIQLNETRLIIFGKIEIPLDNFCFDIIDRNYGKTVNTTSTIATEEEYVFQICFSEDICKKFPCITRCCASSRDLEQNTTYECYRNVAVDFHEYNKNNGILTLKRTAFAVRSGLDCPKHLLPIEDFKTKRPFFDYKTGQLRFANETTTEELEDAYCVDYVKLGKSIEKRILKCKTDHHKRLEFMDAFKPIGYSISIISLAITLAVYLCIPKLQNLHGKILMCQIVNLLMDYIILLLMFIEILQSCQIWAYALYFFDMASYTWLNVLCFDIWRTFSTLNASHNRSKASQNKKLLYYSLYGFGVPIFLLTITLLYTKYVRSAFSDECLTSKGQFEEVVFEEIPGTIFILLNIVFFIMTLVYYNRVKSQIRRMQDANSPEKSALSKRVAIDKDVLIMNVKLFFVMGISLLFEVFGSHLNEEALIVMIADIINILQGLLIFLLFVCKKSVFIEMRKQFGLLISKCRGEGKSTGYQPTTKIFDMSTSKSS